MRIAIYSDTCFYPQVNGVANAVKQNALALAKRGHTVRLFTVSNEEEENLEKMVDHKFQIRLLPSLPALVYKNERLGLPPAAPLAKLKEFRPDVVHIHTPLSVGWSGLASAKYLKIPLVGTHHTFYDHYLDHVRLDYGWAKNLSWKYTVRFYNFFDLVLIPSEALKQELIAKGLKKPSQILHNGIDTGFFHPAESLEQKEKSKREFMITGPSIVYVGRLSYEKNIDKALEAFLTVVKKFPDAKFLVVGDGPDREVLEELAVRKGIKDKVIFTGFIFGENLRRALWAGDIFLTASVSENQPMSILEAMAVGLPVVACRAAGIPEVVKSGENGFLAEPGRPELLAEKINELITNEELRKKFAQLSRQTALNYSDEKIAGRLEGLYNEVIEKTAVNVFLYLEYRRFLGGFFYKKIGTGLLSSYKNQKEILKKAGIQFEEKWTRKFNILQVNTPWLRSLHLMKRAKKSGKKVAVWAHVTPEDLRGVFRFISLVHPLVKKYLLYAYGRADLIFCPTEYTKKLLIKHGLPTEKLVVMSNGVDLDRFRHNEVKRRTGRLKYGFEKNADSLADNYENAAGSETAKIAIGTIGLIIPRKGTDTFIKLAGNFPSNKFIWAGKKYSSLMVKPLPENLPANCLFTGYVEDVLEVLNALDIFIFPSYEENEGMAVLEAAALGLPILVRDIPVYEGWLNHGENCLKAKNDEEFKKYLGALILDKDLRDRLGRNALVVAQNKSKAVLAEKLNRVYHELIKK